MLKDQALDDVASNGGNVAQFVSFDSDLKQRYCRIRGLAANEYVESVERAIALLHANSAEGSLNVRTFTADSLQGNPFFYGLTDQLEVVQIVEKLAAEGWTVLVNETLDIKDAGVSGVITQDLVEIVPEDTPRGVEKSGAALLPRRLGEQLITTIYGDQTGLPALPGCRVEFSVHPRSVGWLGQRVIIWEVQPDQIPGGTHPIVWPNRLSRFLGDKTYGLLIAHLLGHKVPEVLAIGRRVPPFRFGSPSNGRTNWMRTCPVEPVPGKYTTQKGWTDPFVLLASEDAHADKIQSVLWQEGVDARFSGGAIAGADGSVLIEGVSGTGEDFMLGGESPTSLPANVVEDVRRLLDSLRGSLPAIRIEWAHDGQQAWVIQLHSSLARESVSLVGGDAEQYHEFDPDEGLERFREFARAAASNGWGVKLTRPVGRTSHFGDVARQLGVPTRF